MGLKDDERTILGSWMLEPSDALTSSLTPEHFTDARHQQICVAMKIRGWTVADLQAALGVSWLDHLEALDKAARYAAKGDAQRAERRLRENFAVKAASVHAAAFLKRVQSDTGRNLEAVRDLARGLAEAEALGPISSRTHATVATEVMRTWLEGIANPQQVATLPLPWSGLQEHIGGLPIGKLILVGGRSSEHKTTAARTMAAHLASLGHRTVFWTLEDSDADISGRTLADGSRLLTTKSLQQRTSPRDRVGLTEAEMRELLGGVQQQIEGDIGKQLRIIDRPNPTIESVLGTIKSEAGKGARAFFGDFIQLIRPNSPRQPATNDWWRDAVASIAGLTKQLGIVMVWTSQIEKTGTKESAEAGRVPRAVEMPFGAVLRQGAFGCLMVGKYEKSAGKKSGGFKVTEERSSDEKPDFRFAIVVDKWKSAENGVQFDFDIDAAHDRLTEVKR